MHCAGTPELYTPNLDEIARRGMRFSSFFCASPVCSPARASLLTGTIPSAHGVLDWLRSGNVDREKFAAQGEENPYGGYRDEDKPIQYLAARRPTPISGTERLHLRAGGKMASGRQRDPAAWLLQMVYNRERRMLLFHPDIVEHGDIHGSTENM